MYIDNAEAAYCAARAEQSSAMASSSKGDCARLAHEALATLYTARATALLRTHIVAAPARRILSMAAPRGQRA
jgi:hypothetical protein